MPQDSSSELEQDDSEAEFVEVDPTHRYGRVCYFCQFYIRFFRFWRLIYENYHLFIFRIRFCPLYGLFSVFVCLFLCVFILQYKEVLGRGAFKKVYPLYDSFVFQDLNF